MTSERILINIGFYINEHGILYKISSNKQLNEKAKTTNNGSFLKLFKTLTARVLSSLKILGLLSRILNLIFLLHVARDLISKFPHQHAWYWYPRLFEKACVLFFINITLWKRMSFHISVHRVLVILFLNIELNHKNFPNVNHFHNFSYNL